MSEKLFETSDKTIIIINIFVLGLFGFGNYATIPVKSDTLLWCYSPTTETAAWYENYYPDWSSQSNIPYIDLYQTAFQAPIGTVTSSNQNSYSNSYGLSSSTTITNTVSASTSFLDTFWSSSFSSTFGITKTSSTTYTEKTLYGSSVSISDPSTAGYSTEGVVNGRTYLLDSSSDLNVFSYWKVSVQQCEYETPQGLDYSDFTYTPISYEYPVLNMYVNINNAFFQNYYYSQISNNLNSWEKQVYNDYVYTPSSQGLANVQYFDKQPSQTLPIYNAQFYAPASIWDSDTHTTTSITKTTWTYSTNFKISLSGIASDTINIIDAKASYNFGLKYQNTETTTTSSSSYKASDYSFPGGTTTWVLTIYPTIFGSLFVTGHVYSGGSGCVSSDTNILLANGNSLPVKNLNVGDFLLGYDTVKNQLIPVKVTNIYQKTVNQYLNINDGLLKVTLTNQPIYMENKTFMGWVVNPINLKFGDKIFNPVKNLWIPITDLNIINKDNFIVYDVATDPLNVFIGNGILLDMLCN